jgi:hypothetical protein
MYDMLDMANKPDPSGFAPIHQVNRTWWPRRRKDGAIDMSFVDLDACRREAATLANDRPLIVNIEERWDERLGVNRPIMLDLRVYSMSAVLDDVEFIHSVAAAYREGGFTGEMGFYAFAPGDATNDLILDRDPKYQRRMRDWKASNDFHAGPRGLLAPFTVTCPSLYPNTWEFPAYRKWAGPMIDEAKRLGKPVIAFLCPEFHPSVRDVGGSLVANQFWKSNLDLIQEKDIDVILWLGGDNNKKRDWNDKHDFVRIADTLNKRWNRP